MMNPSNQFGLSNELAQAIRLLYLKAENSQISNEIYTETLKIFGYESISLYLAKKKTRQLVDLEEKFVNMCVNSCEAFTRNKSEAISCSFCKENRYNIQRKPRKVAAYFPLIPRIRMQYKDQHVLNN